MSNQNPQLLFFDLNVSDDRLFLRQDRSIVVDRICTFYHLIGSSLFMVIVGT